jgi:hypothetical protein
MILVTRLMAESARHATWPKINKNTPVLQAAQILCTIIQHPKLVLTANKAHCHVHYSFIRNLWHSKNCNFVIANPLKASRGARLFPAHLNNFPPRTLHLYQRIGAPVAVAALVVSDYKSL